MIQVLLDGGKMLMVYWKTLLVFFCTVFGFGGAGFSFFQGWLGGKKWLSFPLRLGVGTLILTILTFVLFLVSLLWPGVLGFGAYLIFLCGFLLLAWDLRRRDDWPQMGMGILILVLSLLVRLAFVSHLVLPPYSDSPTHDLVVMNLLHPFSRPDVYYSFATIFQHYYHYGIHCLGAWLALVSGETSHLILAVIGQFFLVILPFSVYALVGVLTRDKSSAWVAGLMAAIGWLMPAFGVNWGKYPALSGLAVLPIPLAYLLLIHLSKNLPAKWLPFLVSGLLVLGSILLHSRTSLIVALAISAYLIAIIIEKSFSGKPWLLALFGFLLVAGLIFWGWLRPDLAGLYILNWPLMISLGVLLPLAWLGFPVPTLATLLFLVGIGFLSTIPVPAFLKGYAFELLDRQYVQLSLFLPLAVLGGLGLAGLKTRFANRKWIGNASAGLLIILILFKAPPVPSFYPDQCCNYATRDDLIAFDWLEENASPHALVLIAGLPTTSRMIELDSGAWVYPVTGLESKKISLNTDLNDLVFIQEICQGRDEVYVYLGGLNTGFPSSAILSNSSVYSLAFASGKTEIFQVMVCKVK